MGVIDGAGVSVGLTVGSDVAIGGTGVKVGCDGLVVGGICISVVCGCSVPHDEMAIVRVIRISIFFI